MKTLIIAVLALGASPAFADDAFVAGNQAAVAGNAQAAADQFQVSLEHGWSEGALFDLGNAYATAGDFGHAILAYERAQLLAPSDPAVAQNLAHVRAEAGLASPEPSRLDRALARVGSDHWTWLAVGGGALACAGLVALAWAWRRRAARIVVIAGTGIAVACGFAAARIAPASDRAIVLARTPVQLAPVASAETVATLPAGEAVTIEERHGGFVYVHGADRAGWVPQSAIETVIPEPRLQRIGHEAAPGRG